MTKIKYPRIDRDDKLSVKMTGEKIAEARMLFKLGNSINKIAERFNVAWITIAIYVNPKYANHYAEKIPSPSPNKKEIQARFNQRRKKYRPAQYRKYKRTRARIDKKITPDRWRIGQPLEIKRKSRELRAEKWRNYWRNYQRKYRQSAHYREWWRDYYAKKDKKELARKAREWRARKEAKNG